MSEEERFVEQEMDIFTVTARDGREVEMAVIDEFEYENETYAVTALVEDDTVDPDKGIFIYLALETEDGTEYEQIKDGAKYQKVSEAYMSDNK